MALCQCVTYIYCSYWPQFITREIPFYRRWRLLLLILLILWYFRLRHAPSNKLPLHALASTLSSHYADQQRRKGCHIDTYDRARHVMYLEDLDVKTPVSERVVIFLSQKRISIKIGVTDCRIFPLDSMKTTLFKRLWIVEATLRCKNANIISFFRIQGSFL